MHRHSIAIAASLSFERPFCTQSSSCLAFAVWAPGQQEIGERRGLRTNSSSSSHARMIARVWLSGWTQQRSLALIATAPDKRSFPDAKSPWAAQIGVSTSGGGLPSMLRLQFMLESRAGARIRRGTLEPGLSIQALRQEQTTQRVLEIFLGSARDIVFGGC